MARYVWTYMTTALVMLLLDAVWLSVMAGHLYKPRIGSLLREGFDPLAAGLFYVLFVGGLVVFVGVPALENPAWTVPLWRGALFGLVAYATYDLTNQATLRGWSWLITGADLVWGMTLSGISAALGVTIARGVLRYS